MMRIIAKIELLLVGLWLGAACFFSFGVAPSAFAVLQNTELAGNVVNRTLMIVNLSGLIVGAIMIATSFVPRPNSSPGWVWARRVLLLIFAGACAIGQFVFALWLSVLRGQVGKPISQLAAEDPIRQQFDMLHQASVWVLMTGMAAALFVFFVMTRKEPAKIKEKPLIDPAFDFSKDMKI